MKMSFIRMTTLGAIAVILSACGTMQNGDGGDDSANVSKSDFEKAYQAAEAAYDKAKVTDNLWVATEEQMDKAREAAGKGDYATAIKLAKRAQFESDAAFEQYESQKNIKPWLF